jgi:5-methyltetrahydrofolate--homocysteine methyltransferase
MHPDLSPLRDAVKSGNRNAARQFTAEALSCGAAPAQVLDALLAGMDDIGKRFQCNEAFVPEMLLSSRAMKESMTLLEPLLVAAGIKPKYTAVIGTVQGDLHDIGKNLVAMMWKGANFAVVDIGVNAPPEKFVNAVKEHSAQVVGISALLTTTMPAMREAVKAIRDAQLAVRVVVGGAPVSKMFADEIGADGYAADAGSAVDLVRRLVES